MLASSWFDGSTSKTLETLLKLWAKNSSLSSLEDVADSVYAGLSIYRKMYVTDLSFCYVYPIFGSCILHDLLYVRKEKAGETRYDTLHKKFKDLIKQQEDCIFTIVDDFGDLTKRIFIYLLALFVLFMRSIYLSILSFLASQIEQGKNLCENIGNFLQRCLQTSQVDAILGFLSWPRCKCRLLLPLSTFKALGSSASENQSKIRLAMTQCLRLWIEIDFPKGRSLDVLNHSSTCVSWSECISHIRWESFSEWEKLKDCVDNTLSNTEVLLWKRTFVKLEKP